MSSDPTKAARAAGEGRARRAGAARPVVALVSICAISSVLLGVANYVTAPIAAAREAERAQRTYAALMPEAASFEEVPCDVEGCTAALAATDASGAPAGYVIVAQSKGYGGEVPIAVAFDADGVAENVVAMENSETPGLGQRVSEESFIGQFRGRGAEPLQVSDIDTISGATISSKAALAAYNVAVEAYGEVR